MLDIVKSVIDYLIGIQLHPLVSLVVFMVIAIGRQKWEEAEPDPTLRRKKGQWVLLVALWLSVLGQLALYWPQTGQAAAICIFMALGQVGVSSFAYTYAEKWGVMDRVGRIVQKKLDDKGAPNA